MPSRTVVCGMTGPTTTNALIGAADEDGMVLLAGA